MVMKHLDHHATIRHAVKELFQTRHSLAHARFGGIRMVYVAKADLHRSFHRRRCSVHVCEGLEELGSEYARAGGR